VIFKTPWKPRPGSWDIELFRDWLAKAMREGTDRLKVVVGDKPNTWVVTVLDKKE
jgi:hypothetical protein